MSYIDFDDHGSGGKPFRPRPASCHESHPVLEIGGGQIHGGNCLRHRHLPRCDLYVALDHGMEHRLFDPKEDPPRSVYYPIRNMDVPKDPEKFDKLVDLILFYLDCEKRVHIGCIGGHGRTGLVIAAVVARLHSPGFDAISWVRDHYCTKAVETKAQVGFLQVHYGVPEAPVRYKTKGVDDWTLGL